MKALNRILAIVVGLIAGWLIVALGDIVNHKLYPPPAGLDPSDKEALSAFVSSLPAIAFVVMIAGWAISAFTGGLVTGKITKGKWQVYSLITGGILLLASIGNMILIPHPIWVTGITIAMYLPLAYLGGKLVN